MQSTTSSPPRPWSSTASDDRRAQIIALSESGKRLAENIYRRMIEANRRFLQPLEENERRLLKDLLARLRENTAKAKL